MFVMDLFGGMFDYVVVFVSLFGFDFICGGEFEVFFCVVFGFYF